MVRSGQPDSCTLASLLLRKRSIQACHCPNELHERLGSATTEEFGRWEPTNQGKCEQPVVHTGGFPVQFESALSTGNSCPRGVAVDTAVVSFEVSAMRNVAYLEGKGREIDTTELDWLNGLSV